MGDGTATSVTVTTMGSRHLRWAAAGAVVVLVAAMWAMWPDRDVDLSPVQGGGVPATVDAAGLRDAFTGVPSRLNAEVVATVDADPMLFTQGLEVFGDGTLVASGGLVGQSRVVVVDDVSGARLAHKELDEEVFAEGLTVVHTDDGTFVVVLTWTDGVAYILDEHLAVVDVVPFTGSEGWGVCWLGDDTVVTSDGSSTLTVRNWRDMTPVRTVTVTRAGVPLGNVNELECVDGVVWANIWQTDVAVAIDSASGDVLAEVDLNGLFPAAEADGADVINGIAATDDGEFWFAGKLWPQWYRVRLSAP